MTFDVLAATNVLQYFEAPWRVLGKLGVHVARHLLVSVPFRIEGHRYTFDDSTIGTHIDPDFVVSSSKIIDCGTGSQILLVYSRSRYFPQVGAAFDEKASASAPAGIARSDEASGEVIRAGEHHLPHSCKQWGCGPMERHPAGVERPSIAVVTCATVQAALNQRPICCAKYFAIRDTVLFVGMGVSEQAIHQARRKCIRQ